jgi:hypothetical protein
MSLARILSKSTRDFGAPVVAAAMGEEDEERFAWFELMMSCHLHGPNSRQLYPTFMLEDLLKAIPSYHVSQSLHTPSPISAIAFGHSGHLFAGSGTFFFQAKVLGTLDERVAR